MGAHSLMTAKFEAVRYTFGDCELDLPTRELRRAGKRVSLQPRVFHVLQYLLEHPDRLVTKHELLAALWRGEHVNRTAVPWAIVRARKAIGQAGHRTPIQTVHGYGYRFVADVRTHGTIAASGAQRGNGFAAGALASPAPQPASTPAEPFVGHERELALLRDALAQSARGQGQLWVLDGDAGVGKSFAAA